MYAGYEYNNSSSGGGGWGSSGGFGGGNGFGGGGGFGGGSSGFGFGGGSTGGGLESGGGGGGGFLDGGSGNKSGEKKGRSNQSMAPVSIKQLMTNITVEGDNNLFLDGKEMHMVRVIGMVESVEQHSTNINFRINDGTGSFPCKIWSDQNSTDRYVHIRKNEIVRLFGTVREFGGQDGSGRYIQVFFSGPIVDFNEVTHHLLDIIHVHLQRTKGQLAPVGGAAAGVGSKQMSPQQGSSNAFGFSMGPAKTAASAGGGAAAAGLAKSVIAAVNACARGQEGAHVQDILRELARGGHNMTPKQLASELEKMSGDGTVYTGATDDHWLVNDGAAGY